MDDADGGEDADGGDMDAGQLPLEASGADGGEPGEPDADAEPSDVDAADTGSSGADADTDTADAPDAAVSEAEADGGCDEGYARQGDACRDIDECSEGTHTCHPTATCENTQGGYDCTCPLGYSGGTTEGFACAPRIAVGTEHACVLLSDSTVQCWGKNTYGQVGDGTTTERLTPVTVGLRDVVAINAGRTATCALLRDGGLRCWGKNTGALGSGSAADQRTPRLVQGLSTVVAFDIFEDHGCAVLRDGTIKCWGANSDGQLGSGVASAESLLPVDVVGISGAIQVFVGMSQSCAVLRSGAARCWGIVQAIQSSSLIPVELPVPSTVKSISFGEFHGCSLHMSGAAYCWGPPFFGGNGATSERDLTPRAVRGLMATAINVGMYNTVALRPDATVVWWDVSRTPAALDDVDDVVAIASAHTQVCHIVREGSVYCWTLYNAAITPPSPVGGLDLW